VSFDLEEDPIAALSDPRDQLVVAAGYVRALTAVVEIVGDLAESESEDGRSALGDVLDEIRPLIEEKIRDRDRLARILAPGMSTSEH